MGIALNVSHEMQMSTFFPSENLYGMSRSSIRSFTQLVALPSLHIRLQKEGAATASGRILQFRASGVAYLSLLPGPGPFPFIWRFFFFLSCDPVTIVTWAQGGATRQYIIGGPHTKFLFRRGRRYFARILITLNGFSLRVIDSFNSSSMTRGNLCLPAPL